MMLNPKSEFRNPNEAGGLVLDFGFRVFARFAEDFP